MIKSSQARDSIFAREHSSMMIGLWGELEKAGAQIQTVTRYQQRDDQTDTAEHGNRSKNIDVGRVRRNYVRESLRDCRHGGLLGWSIATMIRRSRCQGDFAPAENDFALNQNCFVGVLRAGNR
jgi:hypothetical protein